MRLVSFETHDGPSLGVRAADGTLVDLPRAARGFPRDMSALLRLGDDALAEAALVATDANAKYHVSPEAATLHPPVTRPGKIMCLGLNYSDHAAEGGYEVPSHPVMFMRSATSLVGCGQPVIRPRVSHMLDYEGELAVVLGRRGRHLAESEALDWVAGYSVFNDASVRDYQRRTHQWTLGKNFDRTGAFGPELVTPDEVRVGAKGLDIQTRLNGHVVQTGNTRDMIFDVAYTLAALSEVMTLEIGDVVVTGTPPGVGHARQPPLWMRPGDICEVEIDGIGTLINPIALEADG